MKIDFFQAPSTSKEELDRLYPSDLLLIMEDVLASKRTYRKIFQDLLDIMKYGFEIEEIRKRPIFFKFQKNDKTIHTIEIRHLLSNLILWKVFIDIDKVEALNEEYLFDFTHFTTSALANYIDEKLLPIHDGDFASKNAMIDDICHSVTCIAHAFCILMGMGISLYDIHQVTLRNPGLINLMRDPVNPDLQPTEIEDELNQRTQEVIQIFLKDTMNDFKPMFASGNSIKTAQFREFVVKIGMKADINGNTIPIVIDTNFLMDGLTSPASIYLNAISGRKAMILAKTTMGIVGAFGQKLSQASTSSATLRIDNEMCDSIHTVTYLIEDDAFLHMLEGRYYYDAQGDMHCVDYATDKHLIGKLVRFRSPITCNSKEGVCKYCYGHLHEINKDMFSPGALAAMKVSEKGSQSTLKAKHSQETNSSEMSFSEGFDNIFEVASTEVSLRDDSDMDADLYIQFDDVFSEEMDDSESLYVETFDIVDGSHHVLYHIEEEHGSKMYLNDSILALYKRQKDKHAPISLESIDDESSLFTVAIKNKELTEPIKIFNRLLNTNDRMGAKTISEFAQTYANALISMGIRYDLTHAEMTLRSMIRKKTDILEAPDFSRAGDPNDWQLIKLNDSLLYNTSALVSMPYGYLKKQLLSTDLYRKTAPSHQDTLFVRDLATYL